MQGGDCVNRNKLKIVDRCHFFLASGSVKLEIEEEA